MSEIWHIPDLAQATWTVKAFVLLALLFAGYIASRIAYFFLFLSFRNSKDRQRVFILQKAAKYAVVVVTVIVILKVFGVDLKVILGAAGVLSLAIGFAAQTSVSNLISGLFLIFEKPFIVGDFIEIATLKGEVMSVDLLSMRIKTVDNRLVRVPNEVVMKSNVINHSFYPIRRQDFIFSLAYTEDLDKVKKILMDIVEHNPYCFDEPIPLFLIDKMGEYSIDIKFGVWGEAKDMLFLQSTFAEQVRSEFVKNKIVLPLRSIRLENYSLKGVDVPPQA